MPKHISIAYIDLLTCLFAVFLSLFVVMNDEVAKGNITDPAEFIIEMTWPDNSYSDIDLVVADPLGNIVFYSKKDIGLMTLDRDNLGTNNTARTVNGIVTVAQRREVVTIRGIIPGQYTVNMLVYTKREKDPIQVKFNVTKLNPFKTVSEGTLIASASGEEQTFINFNIDKNGKVLTTDNVRVPLVAKPGK